MPTEVAMKISTTEPASNQAPPEQSSPLNWEALLRRAKLRLLQMHYESGVGHIGGNLSVLDILLCLHHGILCEDDDIILSKGHAAGALYIALWSRGLLSDDDLKRFHKDGTRLSGHPPVNGIASIPFATGSLGHGLGLAAGMALAKRIRSLPGRVFCLTSDGEWNEGSCWESLIFIAHQALENLTIIVDSNGLQGFGTTREVAALDPLGDKFRAFGVETIEVDGHDFEALRVALSDKRPGPRAIVAKTEKGHGVSFMANRMEWHYLPMKEEHYKQALQEISGS
jgi:transketolase